jgi:phospholipid transport system substrate-binding protein
MFGHSLSVASAAAALLVLFGLMAEGGRARAADDPAAFVADLGGRFLAVLTSPLPLPDREKQFYGLVDEGFDAPAIARYVLGPYWDSATESQRQEFTLLFTRYMVQTFARSFGEWGALQMTAVSLQSNGPSGVLIGSRIGGAKASARVDWRLACSDRGNRVVDIIVDGISLMTTQHQQFTSVVRRADGQVEPLLRILRLKTRKAA